MSEQKTGGRVVVSGLRLPFGASEAEVEAALAERIGVQPDSLSHWRILNRSLDARGRGRPVNVHTVGVALSTGVTVQGFPSWTEDSGEIEKLSRLPPMPPVVVGAGPGGLFAALRLCAYGFAPVIIERGKPLGERVRDVAAYWKSGVPDPDSNVQFGEGGAGAFSDGKLTSRSKDHRKGWVLERLAKAAGDPSVAYDSRAHLGTDRLRRVITALRRELMAAGALFRFGERVEGLLTEGGRAVGVSTSKGELRGGAVFLAPGHSARELYAKLAADGVELAPKGFAVGLRVEVPRRLIDRDRYGEWADLPGLGAASYAVTAKSSDGRGVYSFCMCPGGVVVPAATERDGLVINGMSGSARSSAFSNAALVVAVRPGDFGDDPLGGVAFQRDLEAAAGRLGGVRGVPAQSVAAFLAARTSEVGRSNCPWPLMPSDLAQCLPEFAAASLRECLPALIRQVGPLSGGTLMGVETRTSSPVRIVRGEGLESVSLPGLYPVGEGAGYAGGIVSSAIDGVRAVDAYVDSLRGSGR